MIDKSKPCSIQSIETISISVEDMLRHSLVISISDERLNLFQKVFKAHGLEPFPQKIPGICDTSKNQVENCKSSHIMATTTAKEKNWPYVCIFEDDAYPIVGIRKVLSIYLANIPESCDILFLGNSNVQNCSIYNNMFCNYFRGWGSHSYIVFKDYYGKHMEHLSNQDTADYWQDNGIDNTNFFSTRRNLFAQYTENKIGIHKYQGYIILDKNVKIIPEEKVIDQGFPRIESLCPKPNHAQASMQHPKFLF